LTDFFLACGFDIDAFGCGCYEGETALITILRQGSLVSVVNLLRHGADARRAAHDGEDSTARKEFHDVVLEGPRANTSTSQYTTHYILPVRKSSECS